jgi:hypothetical protein
MCFGPSTVHGIADPHHRTLVVERFAQAPGRG